MTKPGNDTEPLSHEPIDIEGAVGRSEICILLDVPKNTLDSWIRRHQFPEPFAYRSGTPLWQSVDVLAWAETTGRRHAAVRLARKTSDTDPRRPAPE